MNVAWREQFVRRYRNSVEQGAPLWIYRLEADLIAGVRSPDGPGQRHVACLGRLEAHSRAAATGWGREARRQFWEVAGRALDGLGERLTTNERRAIEDKLAARVARP